MHSDLKEISNAYTGAVNNRMVCLKMSPLSKQNAAFIFDRNTCRICHLFHLQPGNISGSFKRSFKLRFYDCIRNDEGLL